MTETTPDPADVHTGTDRGGCTCGEGDAVGDTTPGPCFVDASGFTVHRPPDLTDKEHHRRLWRDLADKDIQHGVDWPGVVRVLFADIDALTAGVEFHTGTDRVELTDAEREQLWQSGEVSILNCDHDSNLVAAVESIVAARLQALTAELDAARGEHGGGWFWSQAEWSDWSNRLASFLPEEYDGDEAQEAIIERALTDLVAENAALQQTLDRVTALADSRMAGLRGFIIVKELVDALGGSYDYTGCGQWDGTPGAGYCCDLPVGHAGPHHADHHWPRAALTPEGKR